MDIRRFNGSIMPALNHEWASRVLNMPLNLHRGIDLIDKNKGVELKFKVLYPEKNIYKSWRILEHQLTYGENANITYWGLAFYTLEKLASRIPIRDIRILEKMVREREIYLVKWDWMYQFIPYEEEGTGKKGHYKNTIRFAKFSKIPRTTDIIPVEGGRVNITEGVSLSRFRINKKIENGAMPFNVL